MLCFIMLSSCVQLIWYVIFMSVFAAHWYPFGSFCFLLVSYVWYPSYWFLLSCVHVNATLLLIFHCPCLPLLTYCYCPCFLLSKSSYWFLTVHVCLANLFLSLILISLLYLFHLPSSDLYRLCFWYLTKLAIPYCHLLITVSGYNISLMYLFGLLLSPVLASHLSCWYLFGLISLLFTAFHAI